MSEIKTESIWLKSDYQEQPLAVYVVSCPSVTPHAILQVTHGMAEYWMRYEGYAAFMAQHGYVVCGNDHLGHGATSGSEYPDNILNTAVASSPIDSLQVKIPQSVYNFAVESL